MPPICLTRAVNATSPAVTSTASMAVAPVAATWSRSPQRRSCTTPPSINAWVDTVSAGSRVRSTTNTSSPASATSRAVAAPAHRAPTTTTSYDVLDGTISCSLRCGRRDVRCGTAAPASVRTAYPVLRAAHVADGARVGSGGRRSWASVTDVAPGLRSAVFVYIHQEDVMNQPVLTAELARLHRCDLLRQA